MFFSPDPKLMRIQNIYSYVADNCIRSDLLNHLIHFLQSWYDTGFCQQQLHNPNLVIESETVKSMIVCSS